MGEVTHTPDKMKIYSIFFNLATVFLFKEQFLEANRRIFRVRKLDLKQVMIRWLVKLEKLVGGREER